MENKNRAVGPQASAPDGDDGNDCLTVRTACKTAREAVQKMPQSAEYRYHLGMALSGAGQKDKAKEELSKALQLAPPLKGDDAKQAQDTLAKL